VRQYVSKNSFNAIDDRPNMKAANIRTHLPMNSLHLTVALRNGSIVLEVWGYRTALVNADVFPLAL